MNDFSTSLPELHQLVGQRMSLLGQLADSLESSTPALVRNDVEAIARGAAHQAELCRQWGQLEARASPPHKKAFEGEARVQRIAGCFR